MDENSINDMYRAYNLNDKGLLFNKIKMYFDGEISDDLLYKLSFEELILLFHPSENQKKFISSLFQCTCGSKRITNYQEQRRSADEGTTTVLFCNDCNKKWQYNSNT